MKRIKSYTYHISTVFVDEYANSESKEPIPTGGFTLGDFDPEDESVNESRIKFAFLCKSGERDKLVLVWEHARVDYEPNNVYAKASKR
jgi:hypothetical protein